MKLLPSSSCATNGYVFLSLEEQDTRVSSCLLAFCQDGTYDNYEAIRMDALVSERLTAHFRIVDVYGHCGLSVLATYMDSGDLDQVFTGDNSGESEVFDSGVDPYNKLLVVTEASHALAALHGYQDGVIVHGDFSLCQLLFDESGAVQLDDFNRAEILLFDEDSGAYCKFQNGEGFSVRPPSLHTFGMRYN